MNTATASSNTTDNATLATPGLPAALLLAAGRSTRMGAGRHKLLATLSATAPAAPSGAPSLASAAPTLISHVAHVALGARIASLTIVTGHAAAEIRQASASLPASAAARQISLNYCHNPDYASGIASSIRCGLAALPANCTGVLVLLADMPRLTSAHLDCLIAAHLQHPQAIIVPSYAGQRGNPLLWPRPYFAALASLQGDQGARQLLASKAQAIQLISMPDNAIHEDADTPADAARLHLVF